MKFSNWSAHQQAPSLDDIAAIGQTVLANLPEEFRQNISDIVLQVTDFPDEATCRELDVESPFEIMGLYTGVDLASKATADQAVDVDLIFLFRRPILDCWCDSDDTLEEIVTHVLIHEIGHHFGLSDAAMEALEDAVSSEGDTIN